MIEVLGRSDLTYTNPGRVDNVYIDKIDGERQYLPLQYLLCSLKDLHDILNGTSASIGQAPPNFQTTFSEKLTFSQLYDFIKNHKQYIYSKNIPHTSCLCDTCETSGFCQRKGSIVAKRYRMDSWKHPMTLSRDTAALIRELACSMNVLSAKMENCASWPQMTTGLIQTLTQTQMKFHFTNRKPRISMSRKFGLHCRLTKPLICLKPLSPS